MRVVRDLPCWCALAALGAGCSASAQAPASLPVRPPTPTSVTQKEPGGDATDPERAALQRLLKEPWGARSDKNEQLLAPIPDWEHWKRLRYWGFDNLVGFRYGKEYRAMTVVRVQTLPDGVPVKSETCMRAFEAWARPQISGFDVRLKPFEVKIARWHEQTLVIQSVDGWVSWGLGSADFSAAWTAYPAYKDGCLMYGVAVPWREQEELAKKVRDRFIDEGFANLQALTPEKPYRHEPNAEPKAPQKEEPNGDVRPQSSKPSPRAPRG
ncbi:MAG TPA: hypothetical protein VGQ57_12000 [Polyangiaceae bacterium]|nr:hypothetical protein [Polyangiaceae bacterium]